MKSHQQLVREWKEKFDEQVHDAPHLKEAIWNFCKTFALAAAKGAAEATKINKAIEQAIREATYISGRERNECVAQSERQLDEYFKGI